MKEIMARGIPKPIGNYGYCNICAKKAELTDDHVPPKGCVGVNPQQASRLAEYLKVGSLNKQNAKILQNGLKFRSICSTCNNTLLGIHYDPALKDFAKKISNIAKLKNKEFYLPQKISIPIKPLPVLKAVTGHLLAARVRSDMSRPLPDAPAIKSMQKFVLNVDSLPDKNLKFYCWLYPSDIQVIILGAGLINNLFSSKRNFVVGDVLKFFPIGFLVTFDSQSVLPNQLNFSQISIPNGLKMDEEWELTLNTKDIPPIDWPEYQEGYSAMLLNDELAYFAKKYKKKKF